MGSAHISAAERIPHAASVATVFVGRGQARSASRILLPQVELSNLMYTKKDLQYAICHRRPYRDPLASERFAQRQRVAFVADRSIDADLAYRVGRAVLPFAQHFGESPFADSIAARRNVHRQRLMRSLMVVNLPPRIKPPLAGRHIRPGLTLDDLDVERPMEAALVFALGLRMERSTVADSHAQLEQPDRQSRPFGFRAGRPPGWPPLSQRMRQASQSTGRSS